MNRRLNAKLENLGTCMVGIAVAHAESKLTDAEALEAVSDLLEGFIPHDDETDSETAGQPAPVNP